jgi:hypothetical protein
MSRRHDSVFYPDWIQISTQTPARMVSSAGMAARSDLALRPRDGNFCLPLV